MASTSDSGSSSQETGIHTMVAGVAFQVASLGIFAVLCLDFYLSVRKTRRQSASRGEDPFNPSFAALHLGLGVRHVVHLCEERLQDCRIAARVQQQVGESTDHVHDTGGVYDHFGGSVIDGLASGDGHGKGRVEGGELDCWEGQGKEKHEGG